MNTKLTSFIITALLVTAMVAVTTSAQAQTTALNDVSAKPATTERGSGSTVGFQFTLDNSANLDSLGFYVPQSGAANGSSFNVGIFNLTGTLLAQASVPVAISDPKGDFVYSTGSELTFENGFSGTLSANTDYEIGVLGTPASFYIDDKDSIFTAATGLNVLNSVYSSSPGFIAPLQVDQPNEAYVGPNFTFTSTVPEPSTYTLMVGALALLAGFQRMRRQNP